MKILNLDIYGESHAPEIGMRLSGIPKGEKIDSQELQLFSDRRKATKDAHSTSRLEPDELIVKSGILSGKTTGGTIQIEIKNTSVRPHDYDNVKTVPRPGHADYPSFVRFGKIPSGGGKFSGRMTAPLVAAGGIAKQILEREGIRLDSRITEIGGVKENWQEKIVQAKANLDSVGGIIEATATNLPVGLGGIMFDSIESDLARLLFGIPAVKGVEFGAGFEITKMLGSEANDSYFMQNGKVQTKTNHNGGILGGLTNGQPAVVRVAIKPTPSIGKSQDTVDLATSKNTTLEIKGRHDACIVPRAVVVVEACLALTLLDVILDRRQSEKS